MEIEFRKIDQRGIISTIAGNGQDGYNGDDQLAINAHVNFPTGLFVTDDEQVLFVDCLNHRVRKIDQNGMISTIAGTKSKRFNGDGKLATTASLYFPLSVFQYKNGIYIADADNQRIRKIDENGIISTIVGKEGHNDSLVPYSIFVHNDQIYFSDEDNNVIRKVLLNGYLTTIAGVEGEKGFNGDDRN